MTVSAAMLPAPWPSYEWDAGGVSETRHVSATANLFMSAIVTPTVGESYDVDPQIVEKGLRNVAKKLARFVL